MSKELAKTQKKKHGELPCLLCFSALKAKNQERYEITTYREC
jgi:hypothetical protein